jgi:hypothetical protein
MKKFLNLRIALILVGENAARNLRKIVKITNLWLRSHHDNSRGSRSDDEQSD